MSGAAGPAGPRAGLAEHLDALGLVDHHVHGALRGDLDRAAFEQAITESDRAPRPGSSSFDTQLGVALLRWCPPLLGLEPHCEPAAYLERRAALGAQEVNRRLLSSTGVASYLVDTGFAAGELLTPEEMAAVSGASAAEVVRLEQVAEQVAGAGPSAASFAEAFAAGLAARLATGAVGTKSIVAYRHGFELDPARPSPAEVATAAGRWLASIEASEVGAIRLEDPVILRHLLWSGIDAGLPMQLHVGYGDSDLDLLRCNPLLLTDFLRAAEPSGTAVVLLHCYPYHREAGYLAQMFPCVFFDVGLALNHLGGHAWRLVAESLELGPFAKQVFSSDAWGPAELHVLGAGLWRRAMARVLGNLVEDGEWSLDTARRVATWIGRDNAVELYGLPEAPAANAAPAPDAAPAPGPLVGRTAPP